MATKGKRIGNHKYRHIEVLWEGKQKIEAVAGKGYEIKSVFFFGGVTNYNIWGMIQCGEKMIQKKKKTDAVLSLGEQETQVVLR